MKKTVSDILNCLANLSSDEVFTSPELANQMLDMLPQDLFSDPTVKFLDPCSKSGVFLREIAKRLMVGLEEQIPDLQQRIDHIMSKQLFGIALTQLTAEMSRRTLYCAKNAAGKYSVARCFENDQGNVRYMRCEHIWENGKCSKCGANRAQYDRDETAENYAYPFIHKDLNEIFKNMQFDVIIGNPPYQFNVGVEKDNYAVAIYDKFVKQAKKLNPRYLSMIIPARWYAGGRGLDEFRDEMLHDKHIVKLIDFPNAVDCFPGVDIAGGVCFFLWDRDNMSDCEVTMLRSGNEPSTMRRPLLELGCNTFIRFNSAINILRKIKQQQQSSFSDLVSPQTPFGFVSSFSDYQSRPFPDAISIHTVNGLGYIKLSQILKNVQWVAHWKVYISKSYGERGSYPYRFLAKPYIGEPNTCCTQTYLMIGPFESKIECENVISYINTKFFRFCIMQKKNTQDAMRQVYQFVPLQDFSHPWTDEMLYEKYGLTEDEINFIESMIKPME